MLRHFRGYGYCCRSSRALAVSGCMNLPADDLGRLERRRVAADLAHLEQVNSYPLFSDAEFHSIGIEKPVPHDSCSSNREPANAGDTFESESSYEEQRAPILVSLELEDCGHWLGRWRRKCLQNAVLGICSWASWQRCSRRFLVQCANNRGAGFSAGVCEAANFRVVQRALREERLCVRIISAASLQAWKQGVGLCSWILGDPRSSLAGTLLWLTCEEHVLVVRGDARILDSTLSSIMMGRDVRSAPWHTSVVGAPKARGRGRGRVRDYNFQNSNERREASASSLAVRQCAVDASAARVALCGRGVEVGVSLSLILFCRCRPSGWG